MPIVAHICGKAIVICTALRQLCLWLKQLSKSENAVEVLVSMAAVSLLAQAP